MAGSYKAYAQVAAGQDAVPEQEASSRGHAGPAGGLLIAVGTSLLLWAVIAQAAKFASALLF